MYKEIFKTVACACTRFVGSGFIFAYEATKTAFAWKNLVGIALKHNFRILLVLLEQQRLLISEQSDFVNRRKEIKSYASVWDIFVAYFSSSILYVVQ